jgi:hypothetical protein
MKDLTIIFLTNNRLPEKWVEYHKQILLEAIGDYPLITISRKPMDFGINILQTEPPSKSNIFWQMLKGAKLATTEYVAIAEDDTLYPPGHFNMFRPDKDTVAFNQHRWSLYTWGTPVYSLKNFIRTNATFIGPRDLVIKALEERFAKFPNDMGNMPIFMGGEIGMKKAEKALGVTIQKAVEFKTDFPVIQFDHDYFTVFDKEKETIERRHKKKLGVIQAYDIPYWGKAEELVRKFI